MLKVSLSYELMSHLFEKDEEYALRKGLVEKALRKVPCGGIC